MPLIKIIVSLIPAFIFLGLFLYLDSMKLVNQWIVLLCLGWGLLSAGFCFFINTYLIRHLGISFDTYSGFVAPFVEESIKLLVILWLIYKSRVGFMIDAAIYGFAVGSAFAFAENIFYLYHFAGTESNLMVWITRGFGTALMHGGTTAIFGILTLSSLNRKSNVLFAVFTGAALAILIHGIYNQFLVSPLVSTLIMVVLIPFSISLTFLSNERAIRNWLDMEFDSEIKLLRMIRLGRFSQTKSGSFLVSIKKHYPAPVVFDMYCFISLYIELSIKAKSLIMLRENDFIIPPDPEVSSKIAELHALKKSIGRAGLLAIGPVLRMSQKDLWKISLLEGK